MAREILEHVNIGKALIRPDPESEKTAGGLYVPLGEKATYTKGTVVLCGEPRAVDGQETAYSFNVGSRVLFSRLGAEKIKTKQGELLLVRLEDIVGGLNDIGEAELQPDEVEV